MPPIADLAELLRNLRPQLNPGTFVFAVWPPHQPLDLDGVVALVRESEGLSVVVEEARAQRLGLEPALRCAWITLAVNSDLHAVGLTAAVASALGAAGVPCNVVAGTCHDHLFVPVALVHQALQALGALQAAALREAAP